MAEADTIQSTSPLGDATDTKLKSDSTPEIGEEMASSEPDIRTEIELSNDTNSVDRSASCEGDETKGQSSAGSLDGDLQASPLRGDSTETNANAAAEDGSLEESPLFTVSDETIDQLSRGFLEAFVPHIETSYISLDELMRNQRVLIETVQQENVKCNENHLVTELAEIMTEAKLYHSKLVNIKKDMTMLHERTTKLKKRALKLQQQKMKENLSKEQQREKELEQERHLIARPAAQ